MSISEKLQRLENTVDKIIQKFKSLDHHFEHAMVGKTEKIGNLLLKVDEHTETVEQKVQRLEKSIRKILTTEISPRMNSIENKYTKSYSKELEVKERSVRDTIYESTKKRKSSSFILPMLLAIIVSISFLIFMFKQQQRLAAKMR